MLRTSAAPVASGRRGVIAAKHRLAAAAGIETFERGGNAVDAAVAAAFASGVVEPWMSGLGGGGYLVVHQGGQTWVVDYGLRAPLAATETLFELAPAGTPAPPALFPWPPVKNDANHQGWRSVAVPGAVAGLALALERFGRLDLPAVLAPAIRLASDGFPVDWYTTLRVALDAHNLRRYEHTARTFLPDGLPIRAAPGEEVPQTRLVQPDLAITLEALARGGPEVFYRGAVAERIVRAMADAGGLLAQDDLAAYQARVVSPLEVPYRDWRVATVPGPSGGPTLAQALRLLGGLDLPALGHNTAAYLHRVASALRLAFADRYREAGDGAPWERLLEPPRLAEQRRALVAGDRLPATVGEPGDASTTHLAAADADGTVVSCTQTLLSAFGSRVTVPGTGVLLNNGLFWFDPRPGRPNSPGPGKRPLSNMAPLVALGPGGWPRLGLGSAGGRRIIAANLQLLLAIVDGGLPLDEALSAPRVDASTEHLLADRRLPEGVLAALRALGHDVLPVAERPYPQHFASPAAVLAQADGALVAAVDPLVPAEAHGC